MKKLLVTFIATALGTSLSLAQVGTPADAGLIPRTPTIDVNTNDNNGGLETGDITITSNGNVVPVWEDDISAGGPLTDWEAVWTVYNNNGVLLTPPVTITNIPGSPCIGTAESLPNVTYRSYFRSNGSPTPSYMGDFGGKGKANQFGNGFMFSSGGNGFACEIPELTAINIDDGGAGVGDLPGVQLLNNDGSRNAAIGGPELPGFVSFSDADLEPVGNVRPGDVDFLANGNLLIVGESRQAADRALTGTTSGEVVVYKVLNSSGGVVKAYSKATSVDGVPQAIWHGTAATPYGFAIRFNQGTTQIRLFDNNGNPTTPNIDLAALTGFPEAGQGGRGDGSGFKSNGKDAYVFAANTTKGPWITVINTNGTLRYSRPVTDTNELGAYANGDRLDAAIAADGSVIVAFDASNNDTNNPSLLRLPQARLFDPCGRAVGQPFYLSEREHATNAIASDANCRPRVAWRGNMVAAMWCSLNSPIAAGKILAMRLFDVGTPPPSLDPVIPCSAETLGMRRIVPDTLVWFSASESKPKIGGFVPGDDVSLAGSLEATARLLGDSTFLLAASTKATNDSSLMSHTLVLIPANGGTPKLSSGFYDDAGNIYLQNDNVARQDGNPGRVAGDMRYGAVNYMTAGEATLHSFPGSFGSDSRWSNPFFDFMVANNLRDYQGQNFKLNPSTLAVTPLHKAASLMFFPTQTNGVPVVGQVGRTGSSPIGLANGNFVTVGEDRSKLNNPAFEADAIATIFKPDGTIVKNAFRLDPVGGRSFNMWESVGAWSGGWFAKPVGGITYFFDNDGNAQGTLTNNDVGVAFATDRSDGTRYTSDIRSHYMFGAGKSPEGGLGVFTNMMLCAWDCNTRTFITNTIVSEGSQATLNTGGVRFMDRANVACDAYNRVTVVYRYRPDNTIWLNDQIVARVYQFTGTQFIPLTPEFFPFIEHDSDPNSIAGFEGREPSVAMTSREILFYAKGSWNANANPTNAPVTAPQTHCYTILSHPVPIAAPQPVMSIAKSGANAIISWNGDAGLFRVQKTTSLTSPSWTEVTGGINVATPVDAGAIGATPTYFRLIR